MHYERFYALIGFFVIGALSIALTVAAFLYRNYTHSKVQTFVMIFKGSLRGLEAGTPVTYRGIKIGEVNRIEITENKVLNKVEIPVYVEFFVEKTLGFTSNPLRLLISRGYVADVSKPNFITGIADIQLVKNDNPTATYKQAYFHGYPLFPTRNTSERELLIDDLLKAAENMFLDVSKLVRSKEIIAAFSATKETAENFSRFTEKLSTFAQNMNQFTQGLEKDYPFTLMQFTQTLSKISAAADSTKNLTDYLGRYPEAMLRGKQ